jgi:hypothetical protein
MIIKYNDYMTHSDYNLLLERKTPGQAAKHHHDKEEPGNNIEKLISQLGYEYSFVFIFAPAVKGLYPIIETLITEMELPTEISKSSIVYLTICLIGILLNEPKSKYKDLIIKLKDEKLYHLIKPLMTSMKGMKNIFEFIASKLTKVISSFSEMFAYTALFVPFAMIFNEIGQEPETSLTSILTAISNDGVGKVLTTSVGVTMFALKHFMDDIINKLKTFKDMTIPAVKRVIDEIKSVTYPSFSNETDLEHTYTNHNVNYVDNLFNEGVMKFKDFNN